MLLKALFCIHCGVCYANDIVYYISWISCQITFANLCKNCCLWQQFWIARLVYLFVEEFCDYSHAADWNFIAQLCLILFLG